LENLTTTSSTSTLRFLTTDHLGTPILMTDTGGSQVWQGGFEPFGADYSSSPTILRLPGQWYDPIWSVDLGVNYNVNRWYDGGTGRYTQRDPRWNPRRVGELNLFSYVASNPMSSIDPLGLALMRFCCNPWDKEHLPRVLQQMADLQGAYINQTPPPAALKIAPYAVTVCGVGTGPGSPDTTYSNFGNGACADACTRTHEQSHRDECRRKDYLTLESRRSAWVSEALAYAKQADCLTRAILQGSVVVDIDPLGPGNQLE
jgi:RHS repeat-associated protein